MTETSAGGQPVPLRISIAAQLDPVWRTGRIGQPVHADVQAYAEQMTGYIAENLERFGEHRGADVYVAVSVQRGGETSAHEYRSGHYVKEAASEAASRLPDGTWSCVKDGTTEPCGECGGCRSVQAENRAAGAMTDCGSQAGEIAGEGSATEAEFLEWLNESPAPMRAAFMAWRANLEAAKSLLGRELQSANAVIMRQMAGTASMAEVYADLQQLIKDYSDPERDVIALIPFAASLDQLFGEKYGFES